MREAFRGLRQRHSLGSIVLVCVAVLVVASTPGVVSGLLIKHGIDSGAARQTRALHVAQVRACRRQNIRQAVANRNGLATWRLDTLFAQAIEHPAQKPVPAPNAKQRKLITDFTRRLHDTADSLTWTGLNPDCAKLPSAVQLPVAFSDRQPPASDLPPQKRLLRVLPHVG